jgi:hypothetical protein
MSSASSCEGNNTELSFVREKMNDAIKRLRELEDKVKTIPKLQGIRFKIILKMDFLSSFLIA